MLPIDATVLTSAAAASAREQPYYNGKAYNDAEYGIFPSHHFHSIDDQAPALQVNTWNRAAASSTSHIFIQHDLPSTTKNAGGLALNSSPLILRTDDLSAVYVNRSFPGVANVAVQEYDGKPLLSFYGGLLDTESGEVGSGWIFGYDQNYQQVGRLSAANLNVGADAHEFIMTGPRTGIVTAYQTIEWDLSKYSEDANAVHATVLDSIFQEIDLDTLEVIFQWRASEHIPMGLSFQPLDDNMFPPKFGWDFFHLTSVQKSSSGNYLVSGSHTHSVYEIDGVTGEVKWTLGGKANEFQELGYPEGRAFSEPMLSMAWQHHARYYPGNELEFTVFDNHGVSINGWGCTDNCSRGLHFRLDVNEKKVQLLNEYLHPIGLWSTSEGSVQVLSNGNVFIGWGRNPAVTEHTADGECVFDIQFSPWRSPSTDWKSLDSYRAFKADWTGTPTGWTPAIAAEKGSKGDLTAWVSWNGATQVKSWVLLGSNKESDLNGAGKVIARSERSGFETSMWVQRAEQRYVRAVAVGAGGSVLGASGAYDTRHKSVKDLQYPVTEVDKYETPSEAAAHGQEPLSQGQKDKQQNRPGLPKTTYHELVTMAWSWGGMGLQVAGFAAGIWAFSRLL